jgi:hypothetical protein
VLAVPCSRGMRACHQLSERISRITEKDIRIWILSEKTLANRVFADPRGGWARARKRGSMQETTPCPRGSVGQGVDRSIMISTRSGSDRTKTEDFAGEFPALLSDRCAALRSLRCSQLVRAFRCSGAIRSAPATAWTLATFCGALSLSLSCTLSCTLSAGLPTTFSTGLLAAFVTLEE